MLVFKYVYFAIVVLHIGEPACQMRKEPHMGELIFTDFKAKDGSYSSSPHSDLDELMQHHAGRARVEDAAPSEMPFAAPESDPA